MWPAHAEKKRCFLVTILLFLTVLLYPQENILGRMISLPGNNIRASKALNEISRLSGYIFTYDTQILNTDRIATLPPSEATLTELLDSITGDRTIKYSVVGKHIILYRDLLSDTVPSEKTEPIMPASISGKVTDKETAEPLQYATIGIRHLGKGTVTNSNGEFILRISEECLFDTLTVSYVGYVTCSVPVKSLVGNAMEIRLERDFVSIPEIIVRFQDPLNIVRKAVSSIAANYGTTAAMLTGFYREGVYRKKEPQIYTEAVLRIFKSPYSRSVLNDQVKIIRSRKIENLDVKDTLAVRLKAGLKSTLALDGAKELFDFIDPETTNSYDYHLTDIVTIDGQSAFVISFEQKDWVEDPLMKGDIYINVDDYGIMLAEFEINPMYVSLTKEAFVSKLPKGYSMKPEYIRYRTQYRNIDGRYYLSHVRGDLGFLARNRNELFNSRFNVFFELAVTDHDTQNTERFEHDEAAPVYSIFSRTVIGYDKEFWKGFDFLKPEDDLESALTRLNVRLGEYIK